MKKIIGLAAVLACLMAAVWFIMRPTTLTVDVVLIEGGPSVADHLRLDVGTLAEGAPATGPVVGYIRSFYPTTPDTLTYAIPANTDIAVAAYTRGLGAVTERITVPRGADETAIVVLDAAMVTFSVAGNPEYSLPRIRDMADEGLIGPEVADDGTLTYFLPTGTHRFEASQDLNTSRVSVDVVAGKTYAIDIDVR